jgi:hypothetical protein
MKDERERKKKRKERHSVPVHGSYDPCVASLCAQFMHRRMVMECRVRHIFSYLSECRHGSPKQILYSFNMCRPALIGGSFMDSRIKICSVIFII